MENPYIILNNDEIPRKEKPLNYNKRIENLLKVSYTLSERWREQS